MSDFKQNEDLDMVLECTDLVCDGGSAKISDCVEFWGSGFNILHTSSALGEWYIVSHGDDFSEYTVGQQVRFEDYENGQRMTHTVLGKIFLKEELTPEMENHVVENVGTFK